jgi:hypothetical protein
MTSLIHCIYCSTATRKFDTPALAELLGKARAFNEQHDLTGMLLHAEGSFFQVLEGPQEVVDALYVKIELDQRHSRLTRIIYEPIEKRSFDQWTMGFSNVSRKDLEGIVGANDFFGAGSCFADLDPGRATKLLAAYRDGRWRATLGGARAVLTI